MKATIRDAVFESSVLSIRYLKIKQICHRIFNYLKMSLKNPQIRPIFNRQEKTREPLIKKMMKKVLSYFSKVTFTTAYQTVVAKYVSRVNDI